MVQKKQSMKDTKTGDKKRVGRPKKKLEADNIKDLLGINKEDNIKDLKTIVTEDKKLQKKLKYLQAKIKIAIKNKDIKTITSLTEEFGKLKNVNKEPELKKEPKITKPLTVDDALKRAGFENLTSENKKEVEQGLKEPSNDLPEYNPEEHYRGSPGDIVARKLLEKETRIPTSEALFAAIPQYTEALEFVNKFDDMFIDLKSKLLLAEADMKKEEVNVTSESMDALKAATKKHLESKRNFDMILKVKNQSDELFMNSPEQKLEKEEIDSILKEVTSKYFQENDYKSGDFQKTFKNANDRLRVCHDGFITLQNLEKGFEANKILKDLKDFSKGRDFDISGLENLLDSK